MTLRDTIIRAWWAIADWAADATYHLTVRLGWRRPDGYEHLPDGYEHLPDPADEFDADCGGDCDAAGFHIHWRSP